MPPTTHNLHQQNQYKTQTLAPLRLSQEHFIQSPNNKTNTLNGHYPHVHNSTISNNKLPQLHHNTTQRGSVQHEANNNRNYSRSNSCSSNNSNSTMSHNSQVSTASPDSPPELPIRNGLNPRNNNIHTSSTSNKAMKHYH